MNIFDKLMAWKHGRIRATGQDPEWVPVTRDEIVDIATNAPYRASTGCGNGHGASVAGMSAFETLFAEEMRVATVDLEQAPISEVGESTQGFELEEQGWEDHLRRTLVRRLVANVFGDTTVIKVELECDPWLKWKKRLGLLRWFPMRTKRVTIDGRVLYPYLKIQLPANRHHVRFALRP